MSNCLHIINTMSQEWQERLLERVDLYTGKGVEPKKAQVIAANDMLAEIKTERDEFMVAVREQHPEEGAPQTDNTKLLHSSRTDPMEVSTRTPWAMKFAEDPVQELLLVGLEASRAAPDAFEKNIRLVTQYPNYRSTSSANTTDKQAERFVEHAKSNLLWLYDQVPESVRDRSHLWYDGANRIANELADQHDLSVAQTSGVIAVLSPQKDWFMNMSLAKRVLEIAGDHANRAWTSGMTATAGRIFDKLQYAKDLAGIQGKKLNAIADPFQAAMWVRIYDQTYHSTDFELLSPEGDISGLVTNLNGRNRKVAWGALPTISKALVIIRNDNLADISSMLGQQHKVRNFYNNILIPNSLNGHVTIDTHAVAAALLRPLSGEAWEVMQNFGGKGSGSNAAQGTSGTYGLYAEAYQRAAAERSVLPREMQSITWEAARGLFTAVFKSQQANLDATQEIWENYKNGKASLENTRQSILEAAGGIESPAWYGSDAGSPAQTGAGDARVLPGVRLPGGRAGSTGSRRGGGASLAAAGGLSGAVNYSKRQEIEEGADAIKAMTADEIDNLDPAEAPGGWYAYLLYEARKVMPKPSDKLKKLTDRNTFILHQDQEYLANVDGVYYGVNKWEDPDATGEEDEGREPFVYAFNPLADPSVKTVQTMTSDAGELMSMLRDVNDGISHSTRAMDDYLAARNKGLTQMTPQSVLDADIALATQGIEAVMKELAAGKYQRLAVPIGPMPHVLRMLRAPAQMLKIDTGIIRKILVDKHSEDFAAVSAHDFVMAIYRPALVLKGDAAGEYELVSHLVTPNGPVMFAIKQDAELPGTGVKVGVVMSAYAKPVAGNGNTIAKRIMAGKLLYADMLTAQTAITGNEAGQLESTDGGHNSTNLVQSRTSERTLPASEQLVKPLNANYAGWRVLKEAIVGGIAEKKVKDDLALLGWIGKNYDPKTSAKGWEDAPAFSKRAGPREQKYEHNYLVPEMDGAFDDNTGNIAQMPEIKFQADGISRTLPAMPVRIRVGEHEREGSDATSQYGLQHRIENEQLHQNRGYVTPDLGEGSAAQVEQATRDIVAGVLGAKTAYADTVAGKIYIHAPGQNRMTVLQRKTDSEGEGFWSVVTSMPQTREQMMRKFKAPTTISGIALDGNRSQQSVTIAHGILNKLQEPGLFPSSAESYILDEDGRLYNDPVVSTPITTEAKPAVTISKDANGKLVLRRVQHSIRAGTSAWDMSEPSRFDDFVYKAQNKMIDVKRVIESITQTVGKVADDLNVYLQEELFHGRAAKRTADFGQQELQPLMEQIKRDGYTLADVEEYLHARHAREANAVIAGREASMPDGGSGMTNGVATAYLGMLSAEETRKLDALATQVDAIIGKTRQLYADYGLESQATVDSWGQMFQHYVPLQREDKTGSMGIGQGFSVKGKETKGRTGSTRKVVDIIANIAMQRERLIVRGEKNRVSQALAGLALAHPNPDFWTVGAPPTERVYDPKTNTVVDRADPMYKSRENVLVAKVKRANGEVEEVAVNFNEDDPRAVRMAVSLKNLDAGNLEGLLGVSAKITRYFSAINTQYNPIFGVINLIRDVQSAMLNLDTTPLAGKKGRIAKDTISALSGIYQDMRAARQGRQPTSAWAALWDEFQEQGGQTGFRQLFATSQDRADGLQSILTPQGWMDGGMGKLFTANGVLKVPLTVAQKGAGALFDWLSDYNEAMENGVRLAAYKAGLDQGMSKMQAASLAKNLTVNFNRKGQVGQQAGAVYAFFNAAMQGSARIGQTLFTMQGGNLKSVRLSSTGKKVVYGGLLLGSMQALALAAAGFDDEDPPEFVRERSLIIPTGGKSYVTIPMPQGFNVIPGLGRNLTEFALSGFKAPAKRVVSIMGMFAGNFNPIGNAGMSMQTLAPTALDPLIALTENRDFTGKPIARISSNKALPGSSQYKDTASTIGKLLSEGINGLTGGNAYVAGVLSPTPDQIDYLIGQVTGGVGRELSKVEQSALGAYRGEEVPLNKIPLLGRFVGNAASQASQGSTFYNNINKLNELETEIKGLRKDGKNQEANELARSRPDAYLIAQANVAERQLQRLRREKRELVESNAGREVVKAKEEQMTQVMTRLNQAAEKMRATAE